ncbi:MAG: SDR family NAD(P)-dependent oxidoreductase, partial [Butyricicoccus sp.]|nr:SDR family NAD(P)-dependent oxidoreductase [Butyricicoccus sp.]
MNKNVLNTDLTGKVCVVTGAGGVLCSAFAKALARAGAKVALLGRTLASLEAVADEIRAEGGVAKSYPANVLDRESLDAVHAQILADFGPCDVLVNG